MPTREEILHRMIDELERRNTDLAKALDESVRLQSHYAKQLNGWDEGVRRSFGSSEEWMERLREVGILT
jgi:predicted RNase H-like nuclease (RuvC/YqgF family)